MPNIITHHLIFFQFFSVQFAPPSWTHHGKKLVLEKWLLIMFAWEINIVTANLLVLVDPDITKQPMNQKIVILNIFLV